MAVPPRTPRQLVVVQTRPRSYPFRRDAHRVPRRPGDKGTGKWRWFDDDGGEGAEIVREIGVCPDCARGDHRVGATSHDISSIPGPSAHR